VYLLFYELIFLQAQDVMIWHVPNGTPIPGISNNAFLKYYTDNQFLENNGGTLRDLFKEHAVLRSQEGR